MTLPVKEYEKAIANFRNTTCRSLAEYGRKVLAGAPVTVYYRNKSFDEFADEAIRLRKRLEVILAAEYLSASDKELLIREIRSIKDTIVKLYDHVRNNKDYPEYR